MKTCVMCGVSKPPHQIAPRSVGQCSLRDSRRKGWKKNEEDIDDLFKKQKGMQRQSETRVPCRSYYAAILGRG